MSAYGRVISGGKQMSKGLTKAINDKLDNFADNNGRAKTIAQAVCDAYTVKTLSSQHTNDVKQFGKFTKPSVPKNV
jgi:hypothetical protein